MLKKIVLASVCLTLLSGCGWFDSGVRDVYAAEHGTGVLSLNMLSEMKEKDHADSKDTAGSNSIMYQYSTTLETEKPELDEVTKQLVSDYHRNPTQENYDKLREQVEINYEEVLSRKRAKLEELKETAKEQSKITEMEQIVKVIILLFLCPIKMQRRTANG